MSNMRENPRLLPREFFARPTAVVARNLLGTLLVRDIEGERLVGRIMETEAYGGADDSASHASRGMTPRTEPMFGPPGHAYVYLIYGMYDMLNVVAETEGQAGAVLIRALCPVEGEAGMAARRNGKVWPELANGPGKLARAMAINRRELDRHDLCLGRKLWLEAGEPVADSEVVLGPRVGIDYAAPVDRDAPLRFLVPFPSRKNREKPPVS
ncbi:DNA-3-methyladenine glycosylase [Marinobacter sp.]|uniref:DNA-3-methyladenine glycosylase n=1 Tax=Marinobacter sp. TaxID=50741 RepID=UPI00384F2D1C